MLLIAFVGFILIAVLTSKEDDGKRESINGTEINWDLVIDGESVPGIIQIKVDKIAVKDDMYYIDFVRIFNGNSELISDDNKNGYSKIYVNFDKASLIQMSYIRTKYNGKKTTFYIKTSAIEELLKEDVLVEVKN